MERAYQLKDYLFCVLHIRGLGDEEERRLAKRLVESQDRRARRMLEERCLPRVVKWVAPYRGGPCSFEELIEIGNRALLRGLRRYSSASRMGLGDYLEEKVRDAVEAALMAKA